MKWLMWPKNVTIQILLGFYYFVSTLALEVVVTLCETAPAMVRKVAGSRLDSAIQAMLEMMTGKHKKKKILLEIFLF